MTAELLEVLQKLLKIIKGLKFKLDTMQKLGRLDRILTGALALVKKQQNKTQ
jgi:hypothetical protein